MPRLARKLSRTLARKIGKTTDKGTRITKDLVRNVYNDEQGNVRIQDHTQEVLSQMDDAIGRALEKIGLTAEAYAKGLCPVDTGRLRNSVTHTIDDGEKCAVIGTNVEYAPYIELGTSRYKGANDGRGFLRPAANDHVDKYRNILRSELSQ